MKILLIFIFFLLPSIFFSGCSYNNSSVNSNSGQTPAGYSGNSGGYPAVLESSTRKAIIYNQLDTVMYIGATYFNRPFITAYTEKYASLYLLDKGQTETLLSKSLSGMKKYVKIFASIHTPKKAYNDLGSDRSIWKVYLESSQNIKEKPLSILPPPWKKKFLMRFFPYVSYWSKQYVFKFSPSIITPGTKWIKLIITGVNGTVTLKWNL